ncbi:MAG: hypothetical protein PHI50_01455, partial [Alphaproteobacteria bacterium]|nr:hypothetical protein [Alphaproteobacteria bacterium]
MKDDKLLSSSERYLKKSNRILFLIGFLAVVFFFIGLGYLFHEPEKEVDVIEPDLTTTEDPFKKVEDTSLKVLSEVKKVPVSLEVAPKKVELDQVVIGSHAEAIITLTAKGGDIQFLSAFFVENQSEGFEIESKCPENLRLSAEDSCTIKVLWNPISIRRIQNNLLLKWKDLSINERLETAEQKTLITIIGQSIDSKNCVICENGGDKKDYTKGRVVVGLDGKVVGYVDENGNVVDKDGEIVGFFSEEGSFIGSKGKVSEGWKIVGDKVYDKKGNLIGNISESGDVIGTDGKPTGFRVIKGRVYDEKNNLIGTIDKDGNVLGLDGSSTGLKAVEGTLIVDKDGKLTDYQVVGKEVYDSKGNFVGSIDKNGNIVDKDGKVLDLKAVPGRVVLDKNGRPTSLRVIGKEVYDKDGNLVGTVDENGNVLGLDGKPTGMKAVLGKVILDQNGNPTSLRVVGKDVYDEDGTLVGHADENGKLFDLEGNEIKGFKILSRREIVDDKGRPTGFQVVGDRVYDKSGRLVGMIDKNGNVIGTNSDREMVMNKEGDIIGIAQPQKIPLSLQNKVIGKVLTT